MICHDHGGGYYDDCWLHGFSSRNIDYRFYYWQNTHVFIYFSHERVAIPPPYSTNIAHANGCLSLGTFITESDTGVIECEKILKGEVLDVESGKYIIKDPSFYADKLVELCVYYGFDGYLLNIENQYYYALAFINL